MANSTWARLTELRDHVLSMIATAEKGIDIPRQEIIDLKPLVINLKKYQNPEILRAIEAGESLAVIARRHGVTRQAIFNSKERAKHDSVE